MAKGNNSNRGNKEAKKTQARETKGFCDGQFSGWKTRTRNWREKSKVARTFRISSARGIQLDLVAHLGTDGVRDLSQSAYDLDLEDPMSETEESGTKIHYVCQTYIAKTTARGQQEVARLS